MPTRLGPPPAYWPQGFMPAAVPGPVMGASGVGTPILTQQFTDLRMVVEFSWGTAANVDPRGYPWSDVTTDVLASNQVNITVGRGDEASQTQPAQLQFRLKNASGDYSKGPQSRNYPNVKKGVPVRVRVLLSGVSNTRFLGRAVSFVPGWDSTGNFAYVDVTASGVLRRLNKGTDPLQSTMRRSIPTLTQLIAYWPCEDGSNAAQFASALSGPPMTIIGTPSPATFTGFACSSALPTLNKDSWTGAVASYTDNGNVEVRFLINAPSGAITDGTRIATINTTGGITRFDLIYRNTGGVSGQLQLKSYSGSTVVGDTGAWNFSSGTTGIDGQLARVSIAWKPNGGNTSTEFGALFLAGSQPFVAEDGTSTGSVSGIVSVVIDPDAAISGVAVGHISVQAAFDGIFALFKPLSAYNGETATTRLARLCAEQGESINIIGSSAQTMGPQLPNSFIDLLRECELADGGILYDGTDSGLTYVYRESKENRAVDLVLDASTGDIAHPVEPYDDDLLTVNDFTATRLQGSSFTVSDTTDALAVSAVGDYSNSATVNCQKDSAAQDYASWQVHLGTQDGDYRYPTLNFVFENAFNVLPGWLNQTLTNRLDVANLSAVRAQQDTKTISLLLEGYNEIIDKFTWHATANCSPYDPWRIATLAADTGDTGEFLGRLDSDGSTVSADAPAGSTTLKVATPSGPLWTTAADDCPMTLSINDTPVVVTAISGASSPQTFTVQPTIRHIAPGAPVAFWREPVLEL
jgi:hypothetical protein